MAGSIKEPVAPANSPGAEVVKRRYGSVTGVVVDTTLANCDVINLSEFAFVAVKPSASITSLTVYTSDSASGTFVICDSFGSSGVVTVVASKYNVLDTAKTPPLGFMKLVPNTNGTVDVIAKT